MIDLMPFCSTEKTRYYLNKPFSRGEWTYATNGHICIRVARVDEWPEVAKAPDAGKVIPSPDGIKFKALGALPIPQAVMIVCPECNGECHSYHNCADYECSCERCDNDGEIEQLIIVSFRGAFIDAKYLRMIAALPDVEMAEVLDPTGPMLFRFAGGDGVIMGMDQSLCKFDIEIADAPAP